MNESATSDFDSCRERALRLLDRRAHSSGELTRKLQQRGFPRPLIAQVIVRLEELHLIDDAAFARAFAAEKRQSSRPAGRMKIVRELKRRGIGEEIVAEMLHEEDGAADAVASELARAVRAVTQRRRGTRAATDSRLEQARLFRFLAGRGFTMDVARQALRQALSATERDQE